MNFAVKAVHANILNMQEELKSLETQVLIDMLAKHTEDYTKLMTGGTKEDFELCKVTIGHLQNEINSRQQSSQNTNISDPGIGFSSETQ